MLSGEVVVAYNGIKDDPFLRSIVFNSKVYDGQYSRVFIYWNGGGFVPAFKYTVKILDFMDKSVVMGGDCYSACTFFTKLKDEPKSCATPTAKLHFHRYRSFGKNGEVTLSNDKVTDYISSQVYPKEVNDWIKSIGGLPTDPDAWVTVPATMFFKECTDPLDYRRR